MDGDGDGKGKAPAVGRAYVIGLIESLPHLPNGHCHTLSAKTQRYQ
jgi:hypothetical protein